MCRKQYLIELREDGGIFILKRRFVIRDVAKVERQFYMYVNFMGFYVIFAIVVKGSFLCFRYDRISFGQMCAYNRYIE